MKMFREPLATGHVYLEVSAAEAYGVISDPAAMARLGEEIAETRWLGAIREGVVGARFLGINRNGWRLWITVCTVTDADPGRRFAFDVQTPFKLPVSRWQYDIEPDGEGCRVSETNWLRAPVWIIPIAAVITGKLDRRDASNRNIALTLARLKASFEAPGRQDLSSGLVSSDTQPDQLPG